MVFHNPYGLLALLSVPAIVFLHFFRRSKKAVVIGGLHLWRHAPARKPAGERFTRLFRSLSLLFALLCAVLVSLILSGLDVPATETGRHLVFVLDDSISMNAAREKSSAERAREAVRKAARPGDLVTIIAAGQRPRLLAGPLADEKELGSALASWKPRALACDAAAAADLARKFLPPDGRALLVTDNPEENKGLADVYSITGVGEPLENAAIVFADRFPGPSGRDRIMAVVRNFGAAPIAPVLSISAGGGPPEKRSLALAPDQALSVTLDLPASDEAVTLSLPADALADDNTVSLSPLYPRRVRVAAYSPGRAGESLARAVSAVPNAALAADPAEADLVFVFSGDFANALYEPSWDAKSGSAAPSWDLSRFPGAHVVCFLPGEGTGQDPGVALAQGRDIWINRQDPAAAALDTSGLLWAYLPLARRPPDADILAETGGRGLFFLREAPKAPARYYLDLVWEAGNLFRANAWPLLVNELAQQARGRLPGVDGANFRAGMAVRVNPIRAAGEKARWTLSGGGEKQSLSAEEPTVLSDLAPGSYELRGPGGEAVSRFSVNAFAPAESDLRSASAQAGRGAFSAVARTRENRLLYILLLAAALCFLALSLVFHDLSR